MLDRVVGHDHSFLQTCVPRGEELLAGGGGEDESAG
jgi:hypothetical protein